MNLSLDKNQLKALSEIASDAGQVFLGSCVIPFLIGFDKTRLEVLLSGLVLTFGCWCLRLFLVRGKIRYDGRK